MVFSFISLIISACKKLFDITEFDREAQTLAQLTHPNIVLFMGVFQSKGGERFLVFEHCEEGNLLEYMEKNALTFEQHYDM